MRNLDKFLAQQQESGLIDSSGEFTISADKALTKLAHSQLPEPSYWILKIIQFAAASKAWGVTVVVGKKICRLEVLLSSPIALHQLQKGLDSVAVLENRALDHLVTGLRALGGSTERRFGLRISNLESSDYLFWNGKELSFKREEVTSSSLSLTMEVTASGPQMWNKLVDALSVQTRAKEASLLAERAFPSPFPLAVDGRRLGFSHFEPSRWFTQPVIWDFLPCQDGFLLPHTFASYLPQSVEGETKKQLIREVGKGATRVSAFWHISYHYILKHTALKLNPVPESRAGGSHLHWLKDGVIVRTERISGSKHSFSLELFIDASDCPADLGGLNLRDSEPYRAKRKWVSELLSVINKRANLQLGEATGLWGRTLGGWDTLLAARHMPLSPSLIYYEKPGRLSSTLNSLPGFRKGLLKAMKSKRIAFGRFLE